MAGLTTETARPRNSIESKAIDWEFRPLPYDTDEEIEVQRRMLFEAMQFVTDMVNRAEPRWLVLLGHPGCGKTHLAQKIRWWLNDHARRLYNRSRDQIDPGHQDGETSYVYAQSGAIMAKWEKVAASAKAGDYQQLANCRGDWVKVIDDLGVNSFSEASIRSGQPSATPFASQIIGSVMDARIRKWTVITSNFSRQEFAEQFDTRIASRLTRGNNVVVNCFALGDYGIRQERKQKPIGSK